MKKEHNPLWFNWDDWKLDKKEEKSSFWPYFTLGFLIGATLMFFLVR